MRRIFLEEYKDCVIIYVDDPELKEIKELQLSYREAWGLKYTLEKIIKEPAFKHREPSPRKYNKFPLNYTSTPVVTEEEDSM